MTVQGKIKERISKTNWFLYTLELEDNKYYIGLALNPNKRFLQHQAQGGNASNWCKKHKAIRILQITDTLTTRLYDAMTMEDMVTLKYIEKYGSENVKGGKYLGAESKRKTKSNSHLKRGFISIRHLLFTKFKIGYQELKDLNIYEYISDSKNSELLYIMLAQIDSKKEKSIIIKKIIVAQQNQQIQ